jgi:hypothetical protein
MGSNVSVTEAGEGVFGLIKEVDRGELVIEMEEQLKNLIDAIRATGRKGKISLELCVTPDKKADVVKVSGVVKTKMPSFEPKESIFFMSVEGNLTRHDTRQAEMFQRTNHYQ